MGFLLAATKKDLDREQAALYNLVDNRFLSENRNLPHLVGRCWQGYSDPMSTVRLILILPKLADHLYDPKVTDVEAYIPWHLKCNPASFPYWS